MGHFLISTSQPTSRARKTKEQRARLKEIFKSQHTHNKRNSKCWLPCIGDWHRTPVHKRHCGKTPFGSPKSASDDRRAVTGFTNKNRTRGLLAGTPAQERDFQEAARPRASKRPTLRRLPSQARYVNNNTAGDRPASSRSRRASWKMHSVQVLRRLQDQMMDTKCAE